MRWRELLSLWRLVTESPTQRLFIALWPNQSVTAALAKVQTNLELAKISRPVPTENLHMTLLFLGDVEQFKVESICNFVRQVRLSPFCLTIDRVGFWPRSNITWAGPTIDSVELCDIVKQVRTGLKKFHTERKKFSPHITLARKSRRRVSCAIAPIEWHVREVCVVRSNLTNEGARYCVLARSGATN